MAKKDSAIKRPSKLKYILTAVTLLAFGLLVFFSREQIGATFENLKTASILILLTMVVWQILNYHAYTELYRGIFGLFGNKLKYWSMYRVAIELNFVNHVFPSAGVAGFSYFGVRMKALGVDASRSTLVQMLRFAAVFISFQILLLFGLVALAVTGDVNGLIILIASSIGSFLVVGTTWALWLVSSEKRIDNFITISTKLINWALHRVRPKHPETISLEWSRKLFYDLHKDFLTIRKNYRGLFKPLLNALLANATEVATVYVAFLAIGESVNIGAIIVAYAVANFAGLISVLPGGIGVYEALMAGVLTAAGVPAAVGITATVMYRVVSSLIQLPIGYVFYQLTIKDSKFKI